MSIGISESLLKELKDGMNPIFLDRLQEGLSFGFYTRGE